MKVWIIDPILLVPQGEATEEDLNCVRLGIQAIQAWFEHQGVPTLIYDPKSPYCREPWEYFANYPGGPFYAVQDMVIRKGWRYGDGESVQVLVFLKGYPDNHGESGPTIAVVSYDDAIQLQSAKNDGIPTDGDEAAGLIAHEIGHLMGLKHTQQEYCLMSDQAWWKKFPGVYLSIKPSV